MSLMSVDEYAVLYTDGDMKVRNSDPEIERIFPLDEWIKSHQRFGGKVYKRTVKVVSDWEMCK